MLIEKTSSGSDSSDCQSCSLPQITQDHSDKSHLLAKTLNTASNKRSNIHKFTNSFCNRDITKMMNNINFKAGAYAEHSHKKMHLKRISINICDINNNISVHLNNKNNKNRHRRSKTNIVGRMNSLSGICMNSDIHLCGKTNEEGNVKNYSALPGPLSDNEAAFAEEVASADDVNTGTRTFEASIVSPEEHFDPGSSVLWGDKNTDEETRGTTTSKALTEARWKRERGTERIRAEVTKTHDKDSETRETDPSKNRLQEEEDSFLLGVVGRRKDSREVTVADSLDVNLLQVDAWETTSCGENFVKRRGSLLEMKERRGAKGRSIFGSVRSSRTSVQVSSCLAALLLLGLFGTASCYKREESFGPHMDGKQFPPTTPTPPPPMFDPTHSRDVTALAGKNAILNCRVHNINDKEVSWIRHRDIHLLTVGRYTYTSDQRFRGLHEEESDDWILKINYVQTRDSGVYECQVSTTPPKSHFIKLNVVEPLTRVLGGPDMYINKGSTINLTCVVDYSPEPPDFIYWNHNDKIISYDSERGGVTVIIEKGDVTTSSLLIQRAQAGDTGTYVCNPSNASPTSISVHVLNGEHPAAMQHGGQGTYTSSSIRNILSMLTLIALFHRIIR
ncbi:uncharacterized protein LOC143017463 [Oratosquilla oratoria]|uniref:uncharacterized protein LOC143017463 n=1 Tax=Oratosquilla oratoria TaxID=337810 RepID=UPI003F77038D